MIDQILDDLDKARRALVEVEVAEMDAKHTTLKARLTGGDAITSAKHWSEIDAASYTADRMRKRCEVQRLEDLRDRCFYVHDAPT